MEDNLVQISGIQISISDLSIPKALECAGLVSSLDFFTLITCYKLTSGNEVVVFDVDVEKPQYSVFDIRYSERIAVEFHTNDNWAPWVYALRTDFPVVPHLNLREFNLPKCLCLYDIPYDELKLRWRGIEFLERIREWLKLTSNGTLHQPGQPLEPLLIGAEGILIFPQDIIKGNEYNLVKLNEINGQIVLQARHYSSVYQQSDPYSLIVLFGELQEHGIIDKAPKSFQDLQNVLKKANIDLYDQLRSYLGNKYSGQKYLHHKLILVFVLPKNQDSVVGNVENDYYAVITEDTIWHIGKKLGLHRKKKKIIWSNSPDLASCSVKLLIPHFELYPEVAALLNNMEKAPEIEIALIGAGALGSQTYNHLNRSGFANWHIIDHDILLPHNLARHALTKSYIGLNKALALANLGKQIFNNNSNTALAENFLHPKDKKTIIQALQQAGIILDISASVPVARALAAEKDIKAKRVSVFLNPEGNDLVILAEDELRTFTLDALEMQYYRLILNTSGLSNHLKASDKGVWYANACRSVSARIAQDNLAVFSGIASKKIKMLLQNPEPYVGIWSMGTDSFEIKNYLGSVSHVTKYDHNDWSMEIDGYLLDKIRTARKNKLPNETGGILIGSYDITRRKIYLVETILSPSDSKEYPTAYIRGIEGVEEELQRIRSLTAGNLDYVGEWHSHPQGSSTSPSEDDKILFTWLASHIKNLSRPPLMLIAGDHDINFIVEHLQ